MLNHVAASKAPATVRAAADYLLAWIDFDARSFDSAAKRFATVAEKYPTEAVAADALFYAGASLKEAGDDEKAIVTLRKFIGNFPDSKDCQKARQIIAASFVKLDKHNDAINALKALAADKKTLSDEVLYDLAWSQQQIKDVAAAEQTYRRLLKEYPRSKLIAPARSELGELLYQQGKYDEALALLKQVIADPLSEAKTISVALYRLGSCYEKLSRPAEAAEMYKSFLLQHKDDELAPWAHYQAGVNLARLEKLSEAIEQLKAAIVGGGRTDLAAAALLKLGETQAQSGDYAASQKAYADFLDRFPKHKLAAQALYGIGWALENAQSTMRRASRMRRRWPRPTP